MTFALLLALILLPASGLADEVVAVRACPGRYAQLSQKFARNFHDRMMGRSTLGSDIKAAVADGFQTKGKDGQPLPRDWMSWDELNESQRDLLERLPSLTPAEREQYAKLIRETPAKSAPGGRFKQFMLLGLYDRYTWSRLASDPAKFPTASKMAGQYLEKIGAKMPDDLRDEILTASGADYEELARAGMNQSRFAPQDAVDAYFKHLLRGSELINQQIKNGAGPKEAFAGYFAKVQSYVKGSRFYTADEALDTIKLIQKSLRHKVHMGGRGKGGAEPVYYVGGGLPNGRATVAYNDIDLGSNFNIAALNRRDAEKYLEDQAKKISPDIKTHLSLRMHPPEYWEKKHPVMFKVRASSIDMLVYDANGRYRSYKIE